MKNPRASGRVVRVTVVVVAVAAVVAACSDDGAGLPTPDRSTPSFTISADGVIDTGGDWARYVEIALGILEERHRKRGEVDWEAVRATASAILDDEPTQLQAHRAIESAVVTIRDPHTYFFRPEVAQARDEYFDALPSPTGSAVGSVVEDRIGYLSLPTSGVVGEVEQFYASAVHDLARELSKSSVCGWVIDLRDHHGGSMFPALLGLGPFLGEGTFVTSREPDGDTGWSYRDGRLLMNGQPIARDGWAGPVFGRPEVFEWAPRLYTAPFALSDPAAPVAVLTSGATASAGEWVAIAFVGRDSTRFFGQPTAGFTTGNSSYGFDDGGLLVVTVSVAVDRMGSVHERSISPDQIVRPIPDSDRDGTIDAAVSWLLDEPTCSD